MKAKVNDRYPWALVRAFGGHEYVKYEWRRVPDGHDAEAERLERDGLLDLKPLQAPLPLEEKPDKTIDITPLAAELAVDLGVDLATVTGTGAGGRILVKDVQAAAGGDQ